MAHNLLPVTFGDSRRVIRGGDFSIVVNTRALRVVIAGLLLAASLFTLEITTGIYHIPLRSVLDVLTGAETGFPATVILDWRLPRALAALTFGAALGVSGAVLQSVTRNDLGSPDLLGFDTGAFTGVLIGIILSNGALGSPAPYAIIGGFSTALVLYLLTIRRGLQGPTFILVGVAISAMLVAANSYLMLRMPQRYAIRATIWGQGTLEQVRWSSLVWAIPLILVLLVTMGFLSRSLRQLELGDDLAHGLGTRPSVARIALMSVSVALPAVVTSVTGPLTFIALVTPRIAQRLARSSGVDLLASAMAGAVMLIAADFLAMRMIPDKPLPVGVVTVVIGGAYLLVLLVRSART